MFQLPILSSHNNSPIISHSYPIFIPQVHIWHEFGHILMSQMSSGAEDVMKVKMKLKEVLAEANDIGKVKEVLSQQLGGYCFRDLSAGGGSCERSRSGIHTWGWAIKFYEYR